MLSFNEYLRRRYRCPWDYISFYARWAALFRSQLERSGARADDPDALNAFLANQRGETAEWQMRQAHRPCSIMPGIGITPVPNLRDRTDRSRRHQQPRDEALHRLSTAIRLRHLALRTEDAYRGWTKRFLEFTDVPEISRIGEMHLKAFLTHLAVDQEGLRRHAAAGVQLTALFLPKCTVGAGARSRLGRQGEDRQTSPGRTVRGGDPRDRGEVARCRPAHGDDHLRSRPPARRVPVAARERHRLRQVLPGDQGGQGQQGPRNGVAGACCRRTETTHREGAHGVRS